MKPEQLQQIFQVLQSNLNILAQAVWNAALRHNSMSALLDVIVIVLCGVIFFAGFKLWKRQYDAEGKMDYHDIPGWFVVGFVVMAASTIVGGIYFADAFQRVTQPSWMAAQDILGSLPRS